MDEVSVKDLMNPNVVSVKPDAPLLEITTQMHTRKNSCMIVEQDGFPQGIVTERDLVKVLSNVLENPDDVDLYASGIMSSPPITINQKDSLFQALVVTRTQQIRHLPVVDDDEKLCGVLTYSDLVLAHHQLFETQSEMIDLAVRQRTQDLEEANKHLQELSLIDPLMAIGNRRAMEVDLNFTHSMAIRYKRPYSIALFDVDCFKTYNDHYGHQAGDQALRDLGTLLKGLIRTSDRLYRYGGEEVLLLLPETPVEGAMVFADRARAELAKMNIPHEKSDYGFMTMSGGVASPIGRSGLHSGGWEDVIEAADNALYDAKEEGRNQIKTCSKSQTNVAA